MPYFVGSQFSRLPDGVVVGESQANHESSLNSMLWERRDVLVVLTLVDGGRDIVPQRGWPFGTAVGLQGTK